MVRHVSFSTSWLKFTRSLAVDCFLALARLLVEIVASLVAVVSHHGLQIALLSLDEPSR